jgi:hypothetical protein
MMGVVDDGCTCFVTIDGGYEMRDFESNRSDDVLMSAIVMMQGEEGMYRNERCMCERPNGIKMDE